MSAVKLRAETDLQHSEVSAEQETIEETLLSNLKCAFSGSFSMRSGQQSKCRGGLSKFEAQQGDF